MPGDEVLVEAGVELFEKIDPSRLQNPADLVQGGLPIRNVVENPEAEDCVKSPLPIGQIQGIGGQKPERFSIFGRKVFPGLANHLQVEVRGVKNPGMEGPVDDSGAGAPAATDLQDG